MRLCTSRRTLCPLIMAAILLPSVGCVTADKEKAVKELPPDKPLSKPPQGTVHQVQANWLKNVQQINQGNGTVTYGLAGRVYLFGPEMRHPLAAQKDAWLAVQLEWVDPRGQQKKQQMVFPKQYLDQLIRRDMIGWGYTIPVPWQDYQPGITQVRMHVAYFLDKDHIVYSQPSVVGLDPGVISATRQVAAKDFRPGTSQGLAVGAKSN